MWISLAATNDEVSRVYDDLFSSEGGDLRKPMSNPNPKLGETMKEQLDQTPHAGGCVVQPTLWTLSFAPCFAVVARGHSLELLPRALRS